MVKQVTEAAMTRFVSLYEAKTHLSGLVDRAAAESRGSRPTPCVSVALQTISMRQTRSSSDCSRATASEPVARYTCLSVVGQTEPRAQRRRARVHRPPGEPGFVSAASVWEIAIKRRLGKLEFLGSATAAIGTNGFYELPIFPLDAEQAGELD